MVVFQHPVDALFRVVDLLQPFAGKRREPQLERLGLRRGNRLHQSEKLLYVSHIGQAHLTIRSGHFQTVTICHGFIPFSFQPLFEFAPVGCGIFTFGQNCDNIDNRNVPLARFVVPDGAYLTLFKKLYRLLLGHGSFYFDCLKPMGRGCLRASGTLTDRAAMAS